MITNNKLPMLDKTIKQNYCKNTDISWGRRTTR